MKADSTSARGGSRETAGPAWSGVRVVWLGIAPSEEEIAHAITAK